MTFGQFYHLANGMARMSLKADSQQYYLGSIWWFLDPLIYVAIFYLVFATILQTPQPDFLVFLMCGNLPFGWFSRSVSLASNSIVGSASLIGRINIPKSLFPISIIQEGIYKQLAVFTLLILVVLGFGYVPGSNWLWLIPIVLVQYVMIVSCGLIAAILVCYVRDFSIIISLSMTFLMFVSGIFWNVRDLPNQRITDIILTWNPMAFLLDAYRQVLMYGSGPNGIQLLCIGAVFGIILLITLRFLESYSQQIALRALTA